jgi:hypothetical protein
MTTRAFSAMPFASYISGVAVVLTSHVAFSALAFLVARRLPPGAARAALLLPMAAVLVCLPIITIDGREDPLLAQSFCCLLSMSAFKVCPSACVCTILLTFKTNPDQPCDPVPSCLSAGSNQACWKARRFDTNDVFLRVSDPVASFFRRARHAWWFSSRFSLVPLCSLLPPPCRAVPLPPGRLRASWSRSARGGEPWRRKPPRGRAGASWWSASCRSSRRGSPTSQVGEHAGGPVVCT